MPESTAPPPGRNDPCHCGSGQKYKKCCLEKDEAKARQARARAQEQVSSPTADTGEMAERPREPARRAKDQSWKRSQNTRGVPRFNAPRKVGGS